MPASRHRQCADSDNDIEESASTKRIHSGRHHASQADSIANVAEAIIQLSSTVNGGIDQMP